MPSSCVSSACFEDGSSGITSVGIDDLGKLNVNFSRNMTFNHVSLLYEKLYQGEITVGT